MVLRAAFGFWLLQFLVSAYFLLSKIFFSETAWTIKVKFHVDPPWEGWMKACINGPCHMTKMAATPIYGKNRLLQKKKSCMILKLGMKYRGIKLYKVCINDNPWLTLTYFTTRSNLVAYVFEWGQLLSSHLVKK